MNEKKTTTEQRDRRRPKPRPRTQDRDKATRPRFGLDTVLDGSPQRAVELFLESLVPQLSRKPILALPVAVLLGVRLLNRGLHRIADELQSQTEVFEKEDRLRADVDAPGLMETSRAMERLTSALSSLNDALSEHGDHVLKGEGGTE